MDDARQTLRDAGRRGPVPTFDLEDVRVRKERRERRRRAAAGVVGVAITIGLVAGGLTVIGSGEGADVAARDGGTGLPVADRPPRALAPGEYSYQRIHVYVTCGEPDVAPDRECADTRLRAEAWWALDDSGRREKLESHGYGFHDTGRFGPGGFPDEGDLSSFPTDPHALKAFLLDRSAPDGASPRPEVTPAPGVPLEEGLLWNSIHDYLGSTQYLNATPELRAAMLRLLATIPMVEVAEGAVDPLGRPAVALRFHAYAADREVFVDATTGDFLAMTERYTDSDEIWITLVEEAGFTPSDDVRPDGDRRTVVSA